MYVHANICVLSLTARVCMCTCVWGAGGGGGARKASCMLRQGQLVRSVDLSDGSEIQTVAQSGGPAFHTCVPPATEQNSRCNILY